MNAIHKQFLQALETAAGRPIPAFIAQLKRHELPACEILATTMQRFSKFMSCEDAAKALGVSLTFFKNSKNRHA